MFRRGPSDCVFSGYDGISFLSLITFVFTNVGAPVRTRGVVGVRMVPALGSAVWPDLFMLVAEAAGASVPVLAFGIAFVVVRLATDRTLPDGHKLIEFFGSCQKHSQSGGGVLGAKFASLVPVGKC